MRSIFDTSRIFYFYTVKSRINLYVLVWVLPYIARGDKILLFELGPKRYLLSTIKSLNTAVGSI